jgi:hypothetical protein
VYDELKNINYLTNGDGTWINKTENQINKTENQINKTENQNKIKEVDFLKVLGTPKKFGSLEVAEKDFPYSMNFEDAKVACDKLGPGWRLPTIDELKFLFKKKNKVLAKNLLPFLSSTIDPKNGNYFIMGKDGLPISGAKSTSTVEIRAVRGSYNVPSRAEEINEVVGVPIGLGKIQIAQFDIQHYLTFEEAKKACQDLGDGWRLPTRKELELIYKNREKISELEIGEYWSSSEYDGKNSKTWSKGYWVINFNDGNNLYREPRRRTNLSVRAVRSL